MGKRRRPNSIKAVGDDITKPVDSFKKIYKEYDIADHLREAIVKSGYKAPTAVQSQAIPLMLNRREIICSAPTGSGKTLAFILPIIHQLKEPKKIGSFRALILEPTRELAKQVHREALWISQGSNLRIHHLKEAKEAAKKFGPESNLKYDILVTTPNKLSALLLTEPPSISLSKLEWLVIDECDRLFELGFKDDLTTIYKYCLESDQCRRALFSATLENNLVNWAQVQMDNVATVIVGGKNRTASNIEQQLIYVGNNQGKMLSIREIISSGIEVPVLIFVETKEKAKHLANEFLYDNLNIEFIHSEREQSERDAIVAKFREGKIWFLVCTDLMGRGIDFKGVNVVINYDCPKTYVSYIHRIGRTGRADRQGKAITFVADEDVKFLPQIVKVLRRSGQEIPKQISTLLDKKKEKKKKRKEKEAAKDDAKKNKDKDKHTDKNKNKNNKESDKKKTKKTKKVLMKEKKMKKKRKKNGR